MSDYHGFVFTRSSLHSVLPCINSKFGNNATIGRIHPLAKQFNISIGDKIQGFKIVDLTSNYERIHETVFIVCKLVQNHKQAIEKVRSYLYENYKQSDNFQIRLLD